MSLSSANRSLQLLTRILDTNSATEAIVDLGPQKPEIPLPRNAHPLPRAVPEQHGIPSRQIAAFLRALDQEPDLRMHSILVIRHGHVLCEAPFGTQDTTLPRMTFSACKSVTVLAIGLLMDDGLLHPEDKLTDLFPNDGGPVSKRLMKDLTLEHLLTMQTGNLFNEGGSVTALEWTRSFFSSVPLELNRKFQYNSLNTYMLAVLVTRITGKSLSQFLTDRLFTPMGIEDFYWETSPEGVEKGGWGLYMRAEDLGKLGQLLLDNGCWDGKQLLSADFVRQATSAHVTAPASCGDFNYGWQIWVGRKENTFLFNGMLGQNVLCFRNSGVILVSHAGNDETFQTSPYFPLAMQYFGVDFPQSLPRDAAGERELRRTLDALAFRPNPLPSKEEFLVFAGKRFVTDAPQAASAGLLPLTLQAVENCYSKGLRAISIAGSRTAPVVLYEEQDQLHQLICGIKEPCYQVLCFRDNYFRTAVQARFTHNEEEEPVLRIQVDFLETPCQRILKLIMTRRGLVVKQEEYPGTDYVTITLSSMVQGPARPLMNALLGSTEQGFLRWKTERVFSPVLHFREETE